MTDKHSQSLIQSIFLSKQINLNACLLDGGRNPEWSVDTSCKLRIGPEFMSCSAFHSSSAPPQLLLDVTFVSSPVFCGARNVNSCLNGNDHLLTHRDRDQVDLIKSTSSSSEKVQVEVSQNRAAATQHVLRRDKIKCHYLIKKQF